MPTARQDCLPRTVPRHWGGGGAADTLVAARTAGRRPR
eukprot:COSAG01_NODE_44432_length_419_cov_0.968750_1_plen_37_part_10